MNIANFLKKVDAFQCLNRNSAKRLAERVTLQTYRAGQMILRRGDPGDSMFVIISGDVQIPIVDANGRQSMVVQLGEQQFFGEMALLTGEPRSADVIAATECTCAVIPKEAANDLITQYPEIGRFLTEILGERLNGLGGIQKVGKYRLIGELGRGGMAVVFEGVHPTLGRPVAIKMLSHELVYHEHFADRFRNEAKIIANLRHQNIVEVFDTEEAYATFFIVMEKLLGKDLDRVLEDRVRLSYDETREIVKQMASALGYAHKKGVYHRDVKPSNIVIEPDGTAKLTDYGLALVHKLEKDLNVRKGISLGTPTYMSPEQAMARSTDGRSDIYSLGIVAYEMLTGYPPFPSEDPYTVMKQHVNEAMPSIKKKLPNVPDDLAIFIKKATEKKMENRYQTCEEILSFFNKRQIPALTRENVNIRTMTFVFPPSKAIEVNTLIERVKQHAARISNLIVE